jgi:hypothetical protein
MDFSETDIISHFRMTKLLATQKGGYLQLLSTGGNDPDIHPGVALRRLCVVFFLR